MKKVFVLFLLVVSFIGCEKSHSILGPDVSERGTNYVPDNIGDYAPDDTENYVQPSLITFEFNGSIWVTEDVDSVALGKIEYIVYNAHDFDPGNAKINLNIAGVTAFTLWVNEVIRYTWVPLYMNVVESKIDIVIEEGIISNGTTIQIYIKGLQ